MVYNFPARVRDLLTGYIYADSGSLLETMGSSMKLQTSKPPQRRYMSNIADTALNTIQLINQTSKTGYSYQDNTCFVELFISKDWFSWTPRNPYFWKKKINISLKKCFTRTTPLVNNNSRKKCTLLFYLFRTVASACCSQWPGTISTETTRYGFAVIMARHFIKRTAKAGRSHVSRYWSWHTER